MLVEIAKPVTLIFCILSLWSVFDAAFLAVSIDMNQKICDALGRLVLAAVISLLSGFVFRNPSHRRHASSVTLTSTLPVKLFCWASVAMLVLFVISWYLETYCVFYRDVRF
jgi:hypothetical protein